VPTGVLFVCYANMCRSPMAERLCRHALSRWPGPEPQLVPVGSAGTHADGGMPMHPHAAAVLAERGIDPAGFTSRTLTSADILDAGLVLTAGRAERTACVSLAPAAIRHIFTIRQFGRLSAAALGRGQVRGDGSRHADRLDLAVDAAIRARGQLQPVGPDADDLEDPVGAPISAFRRCANTIEAALDPVLTLIAACGKAAV